LKRTTSLPFLVFILLLLSASVAFSEVPIRVRIIQASSVRPGADPAFVDRPLKDIYRELGTLFNFNSYRLLQDVNLNLTGNRSVDIIVHPGRSMEITLVGEYRNLVELRIRVKREGSSILVTHVRLSSGRTILIGGPRHGEGTIIFAISGRF
jgi:hypothetical protein